MAVEQVFQKNSLYIEKIALGEVVIGEDSLTEQTIQQLDKDLIQLGFERIDDRKARMIEMIKNKVIQLIHHTKGIDRKYNWSKIVSDEVHYEYNYLSNLFSSVEGITLEQYIIRQKIEKAKELLFYDELTLSEIANQLGYSSVAHLSAQFKKVTGLTPSELKKTRDLDKARKPLDDV
jgi:AraC-like DNA-binding protein